MPESPSLMGGIWNRLKFFQKDLDNQPTYYTRHSSVLRLIVKDRIHLLPQQLITLSNPITGGSSNDTSVGEQDDANRASKILSLPPSTQLPAQEFKRNKNCSIFVTVMFALCAFSSSSICCLLKGLVCEGFSYFLIITVFFSIFVLQVTKCIADGSREHSMRFGDLILAATNLLNQATKLLKQAAGAIAGLNHSQRQLTAATVALLNGLNETQIESLKQFLEIIKLLQSSIGNTNSQITELGTESRRNMNKVTDAVIPEIVDLINAGLTNLDRIGKNIDDFQRSGTVFLRSDVNETLRQLVSALDKGEGLKKLVNIEVDNQVGFFNNRRR